MSIFVGVKTANVLVVDDMPANRKLLGRIVESYGCSVEMAETGEEAIEKFQSSHIDLILMDIRMPGIGGKQASWQIKKLAGNRYIPIIYITAYRADDALASALDSGGDDFLTKPVDASILLAKIRAHLRICKLNEELMQHNARLSYEENLMTDFFANISRQGDLDVDFLKFHISPASTFNGDLLLCKRRPDGKYHLLLCDFTGHGLTAALGTIPVSMIFTKMSERGLSLDEVIHEINEQLLRLLPKQLFCAAAMLEIDVTTRTLNIWSGGFSDIYVRKANDDKLQLINSSHPPLGIRGDDSFDVSLQSVELAAGDRCYVYTDGLTEAENEDGEQFGEERLRALIEKATEDALPSVLEAHSEFCNTDVQVDDISIVEIAF